MKDATTWDGKPIASDWPTGATVVVYRRTPSGTEFLLLHRAHHGSDYEGDWAWTPPAGARHPGESIEDCAARELKEEAGLQLPLVPLKGSPEDWRIFAAEAPADVTVVLEDPEHDRHEWVSLAVALTRCRPDPVARGMEWAAALMGV